MSEVGRDSTLIEFCGTGVGINVYQSEPVRISGFSIRRDPGCGSPPGLTYGVRCSECTDVIVENCEIEGVAYGICFEGASTGSWYPVFRSNIIRNCGSGIGCLDVYDPQRPLLEGNLITDCSFGVEIDNSSPVLRNNEITYSNLHGLRYEGSCGGSCDGNVIAHTEGDGVWIYADPPLAAPDFNGTYDLAWANDFYDNAGYHIYYDHPPGQGFVLATLNYWGSRCPDFAAIFHGTVIYECWTDSTHTDTLETGDCLNSVESQTWGQIKALFR
jgi:parallel beta-helix repeat protein